MKKTIFITMIALLLLLISAAQYGLIVLALAVSVRKRV